MTSWLAFLTHDLLSFLTVAVLVSLLLLETGCQDPQANFKYHCVVEDDSELLQPPRPPGFQSPGCFTTHGLRSAEEWIPDQYFPSHSYYRESSRTGKHQEKSKPRWHCQTQVSNRRTRADLQLKPGGTKVQWLLTRGVSAHNKPCRLKCQDRASQLAELEKSDVTELSEGQK